MEFAWNVLISTTHFYAQGCVQVYVPAVRPVLPSHVNQPQQPIGTPVDHLLPNTERSAALNFIAM
jgi:hypothetical protein